jgi:hypothetical protein
MIFVLPFFIFIEFIGGCTKTFIPLFVLQLKDSITF